MIEPSTTRRALDRLLEMHPGFDVLAVEWSISIDGDRREWTSPWVLVDLGQPSENGGPAWAIWKFAILRATGDTYPMRDGAVGDDPLFVIPS